MTNVKDLFFLKQSPRPNNPKPAEPEPELEPADPEEKKYVNILVC